MTDHPHGRGRQPDADDGDVLNPPAPGRSVFGDDEISFSGDDDVVPHWREPATGTVPLVGTPSAVPFDPSPGPRLTEPDTDELTAWSGSSGSRTDDPLREPAPVAGEAGAADDFFEFDDEAPRGRGGGGDQIGEMSGPGSTGGDRDMPMAVVVGVGLGGLILAAMAVSPLAALAVITIAMGLAAAEYFNAKRAAGYQPAVLLGLVATVGMPVAVYWRGEEAMGLLVVLSFVFGTLWYVTGVAPEGAVRGLGSTMTGILHIGLLGSFAALLLDIETYGTGLLTTAIVLTAAYDIGGLLIGRIMGQTPLTAASPNKTMEGLVGGVGVVLGVAIIMGVLGSPAPLANSDTGGGMGAMILLGAAIAIAAPIGDLAESVIKRDLGVKDMGSILPGHGGLMDRFDGMLFALPATWYVSQAVLV